MSFQKDFPTLFSKAIYIHPVSNGKSVVDVHKVISDTVGKTYVEISDVQKHCLDKQKVLQELNELEKDALGTGLTEQLEGAIKRLKHRWGL